MTRLLLLLRYGLVGLASNGLGYLAYLALTATGLPPKLWLRPQGAKPKRSVLRRFGQCRCSETPPT